MSSPTTFAVPAVPTPVMPRGARVAADLFAWAAGWLRTAPPAPQTRAEEAAAARELAYRMMDSDPGFAADLFAAAARHESRDD